MIENWRPEYNEERPKKSLGGPTPAQYAKQSAIKAVTGLRSQIMLHANGIMPVLRVADIQKAVGWYTNRLGFELCWRKLADGGGENAMLRAGAVTMMLSTGQHLGDKPALTGTLYLNVEDVANLFESVKNDVDLVWPLETMDYGTVEFGIRDCDGYVLAFAEQTH